MDFESVDYGRLNQLTESNSARLISHVFSCAFLNYMKQ